MKDNNLKLNNFINKAINKFGNKYDYSKVIYKNNKINIKIICSIHGEFEITPDNFLNNSKYGCSKCGIELGGKKRKSNTELFIEKANLIHNNNYIYTKVNYIETHEKICIICPKHGEFWQIASSHLQGHGCIKCKNENNKINQLWTLEKFIERAKKIHGVLYDYSLSEYNGSNKPIKIICKIHGEFEQLPLTHIRGATCPKCKLKNQNLLYEKLKKDFLSEHIEWEYSPEWLGRQRFDISFPKYNIAIEYNGRQHYVPVKQFGGKIGFNKTIERDSLKKKKCIENNWSLFELKYNYNENEYKTLLNNIQLKINSYA